MTSEPVGNGPRSPGEIPGNTHRERAAPKASQPQEDRAPMAKVVEGKVTVRKQPVWKRAARSMIADDAQHIGDYLLVDVIVPAAKNLIRDIIFGGTERALYGGRVSPRRGSMGTGREPLRTRYDKMSEGSEARPRAISRESRARHDFADIVLDDREEALIAIEAVESRIVEYGTASVADLYDALGVTGSFADRGYGWNAETFRDADIRQSRGGWLLDLPQPSPLRR